MQPTPFPQSYWVKPGLLCAGQYPGDTNEAGRKAKIQGLVACGIRRVLSLMEETETGAGGKSFAPYAPGLIAAAGEQGINVECLRLPIRDASVPSVADMKHTLDVIDALMQSNIPIYVHCWGGHGRTSTVIACWLVRHGMTGEAAIAQILKWRKDLPKHHYPLENEQEDFVLDWKTGE